jgi:hypothetical protein
MIVARRRVTIAIVIDLLHLLEHPWLARGFLPRSRSELRGMGAPTAPSILNGNARAVAAGILRRLAVAKLPKAQRGKANPGATCPAQRGRYSNYALAEASLIAAGIVEGARRCLELLLPGRWLGLARIGRLNVVEVLTLPVPDRLLGQPARRHPVRHRARGVAPSVSGCRRSVHGRL